MAAIAATANRPSPGGPNELVLLFAIICAAILVFFALLAAGCERERAEPIEPARYRYECVTQAWKAERLLAQGYKVDPDNNVERAGFVRFYKPNPNRGADDE